jgi:hypothetical protein
MDKQQFLGNSLSILPDEMKILTNYCIDNNVQSILEFGPGVSTNEFSKIECVDVIHSYEAKDDYYKNASEVFMGATKIQIYKYDDSRNIEDILAFNPPLKQYDFGFVDGPYGPSYRIYSRINSCIIAKRFCKTFMLHDCERRGEVNTLLILKSIGMNIKVLSERLCLITPSHSLVG